MDYRRAYTFDDLVLVPLYSDVKSRKAPSTETVVGQLMGSPILSAPMWTVTESKMIEALASVGANGVIHRYMSIPEQVNEFTEVDDLGPWVAVGASRDYLERAAELSKAGARMFCVDVANGHTEKCLDAVRELRHILPDDACIMAGNVCTSRGARDLERNGANVIRVGIGAGSACITRQVTGFGVPQLSAVRECSAAIHDDSTKIVSDGGIRSSGDIVKALAMGADAVMIGGLLAGTDQAPGTTYQDPDTKQLFKFYHGMACYSSDTEILTLDGWKCVKEVSKKDIFATLNPDSKELEYQSPSKVFEYTYSGKMVKVSSKFIDLLVTPNHNLYCKPRHSKEDFSLVKAEDSFGKERAMEKKCSWLGKTEHFFSISKNDRRYFEDFKLKMSEWLDFFGFWIAEGSCGKDKNYSISISNNNEDVINHYFKLISSWGNSPFVRKRDKNYELTFSNASLCCYLRQFGKAHEKYIPVEFKKLSAPLLEILLHSIALGDGCASRDTIYTNSVRLRDDIWELAFKCGMSPSININHKKGSPAAINGKRFTKKHTVWEVGRLNRKIKSHAVYKKNWDLVDYNDKVYCVEVPNHIVCVRRNNKHVWCGNSEEGRKKYFDDDDISFVPEGDSHKVWHKGDAVKIVKNLNDSIKVGMSFAGAMTIEELQHRADWREVTPNGNIEGNSNRKMFK